MVRACYGVAAKCYEVYEFTDVLTQGRVLRALSEELLSSHVFSKFPAIDGARRFITLFVQADEANINTLYFIMFHCAILPPTYDSSKIPFFCSYPTISPMRSTFIASLILILCDSANDVRRSVQIMEVLITVFCLSLTSKLFSQLTHSQTFSISFLSFSTFHSSCHCSVNIYSP